MSLSSVLLLFPVAAGLLYHLIAWTLTWRFYDRPPETTGTGPWPPVSILKPVTRIEAGTRENFKSFCLQDYPHYEILFALQEQESALIAMIEELAREYPHRSIRWVLSTENCGPNYKVGNLRAAEKAACHEILVLSDADMRVASDWLRRVVSELRHPEVGLVTCLYRHVDLGHLPDALQALTVQTLFVPSVMVARRLEGLGYGFGATLCVPRSVLQQIGGLEVLLPFLADDYHLGRLVREKGWEVRLSSALPDHVSDRPPLMGYLRHQLRWAVTQRVCRPGGTFAAVITHLTTWSLLLAIGSGFAPWALALLGLNIGLRVVTSAQLDRAVFRNGDLKGRLWLIPLNDLLQTAIWALSFLTSTVRWQGKRFRLRRGGQMEEQPVRETGAYTSAETAKGEGEASRR